MSQRILVGDVQPEMKIGALVAWFGCKRTLADRIVLELGDHTAYVEPFCGGLAVLLAKPESSHETVNDLHGDLINLAKVVQHAELGPKFYRRLRRYWMHQQFHAEAKDICAEPFTGDAPDLERAVAYFVWSWFGRNGVSGTDGCNNTSFARMFTTNGGHGGKRFTSAVESIPAWRRRMRRVTILKHDAFDLLERLADGPSQAIYCDPPYIVKGAKYQHDFTEADHARLAELLARFKQTRVVVSYYDHPLLDTLYPGWTKVHCPVTKSLVNQGMRDKGGAVKAPEVLLINGPSYTSGGLFTEVA